MQPSVVLFVGSVLVLLATAPTGSALQCWTCSSDLDPKCVDPFNATDSRNNAGYVLTNCDLQSQDSGHGQTYPYMRSSRSVCKKSKKIAPNGDLTVFRACSWQMPDQPIGDCHPTGSGSNTFRVIYCQTCDHDGCNSATGLAFLPALISLPILAVLRMR